MSTPPRQIRLRLPPFLGRALGHLLTRSTAKAGQTVPPPPALGLTRRSLLYFKSEGCAPCDGIDLFIGRLAAAGGLDLRVVDARRGEVPEQVYGGSLLLDREGSMRRAYGVRVFPTLLVTGPGGQVERVLVGADANEEQVRAGLGLA
ncbi:thioredoxin family protein [Deinococcus sp. NW-56]|uniref:TlpA family protein disulfide reductase n=1 Tax=Deinococcus sp. NW-56 TaxID=2080419 RepID=UPI000CF3A153|nr:thioredoxin family protein [Deinococcus sp. NW-56]